MGGHRLALPVEQYQLQLPVLKSQSGDQIRTDRVAAESSFRRPLNRRERNVDKLGADDLVRSVDVEIEVVFLTYLAQGQDKRLPLLCGRQGGRAQNRDIIDIHEMLQ